MLIIVSPEDGDIYIGMKKYVSMSDTMIGKQRYRKTKKCHHYSRKLQYHRVKKKRCEKVGLACFGEGVIKRDVITVMR